MNSKIPDIGEIQGKARVMLSDYDKQLLVDFLSEMKNAGRVKGTFTIKRIDDLIYYLKDKMMCKHLVVDATTLHIVWTMMEGMAEDIAKNRSDVYEQYLMIMMTIADCLDAKIKA